MCSTKCTLTHKPPKGEQTRYMELQNRYIRISDKLSESEEALRSSHAKENEMTALIKDLSKVVKEQKDKISSLIQHSQSNVSSLNVIFT